MFTDEEWRSSALAVLTKRTAEWNKIMFPKGVKKDTNDTLQENLDRFFGKNPFSEYKKDAIELAEILTGKKVTPKTGEITCGRFIVLKAKAPLTSNHRLSIGTPYFAVTDNLRNVGPTADNCWQQLHTGEFEAASPEDVRKFVENPFNLKFIKEQMHFLQYV